MSPLAWTMLTAAWLAANPSVPGPDGIDRELGGGTAIYGGEQADPGEWPAVVAVRTGKLCTGTLVGPDLVLTAAHCLDPEPSGAVQIYFGDDLSSGTLVLAEDWGRHPDFCLPADCGEDLSDFAWIRLPSPMSDIPLIPPITNQAEFDEVMRVGQPLWFVGFGEDDEGLIGTKREVLATLTGFNESGREFRAGGGGKDTCYGDSGGPALVELSSGEWRIAGVISRGGACGEGGVYGVPLPELCWVRDSSGVDLLPDGCESCDCVVLQGDAPDEGCDCKAAGVDGRGRGWWLALELGLLLGVVVVRNAGRRGAVRSSG
ncbi:MAG: trypsin-like serine protease [Enhygromyxa sp.]